MQGQVCDLGSWYHDLRVLIGHLGGQNLVPQLVGVCEVLRFTLESVSRCLYTFNSSIAT